MLCSSWWKSYINISAVSEIVCEFTFLFKKNTLNWFLWAVERFPWIVFVSGWKQQKSQFSCQSSAGDEFKLFTHLFHPFGSHWSSGSLSPPWPLPASPVNQHDIKGAVRPLTGFIVWNEQMRISAEVEGLLPPWSGLKDFCPENLAARMNV